MSSSLVVVAWSRSYCAAAAAQTAAALSYDPSMRDFVAVSLWVYLLLVCPKVHVHWPRYRRRGWLKKADHAVHASVQ